MNLREIITVPASDELIEKQIWGRRGNKAVRKYRCAGGQRHGRIVAALGPGAV